MNKIKYVVILGLYTWLSCAEPVKIIVPDDPVYPTSGVDTMTNVKVDGYYQGFYFPTGAVISYPNTSQIYPDVMIRLYTESTDTLVKMSFRSVVLRPTFSKLQDFNDSLTAMAWFDSLKTLTDTVFTDIGYDVKEYQVWAIRTQENKYAKLLVTGMLIDTNAVAKIVFKWVYQPDGSMNFPIQ
jgi:hypothetical protein